MLKPSRRVLFSRSGCWPELLHPLWFGFENVEGRNAGRGNGWRMRGRKQKWARAVAEKIDQIASATDVSTESAVAFDKVPT